MPPEPTRWTMKGFLSHFRFVHDTMKDHPFAWVLGAGASRASGIPTGGQLVAGWLKELHERLDKEGRPLAEWATAENLDIKGFEYDKAPAFYPRIYERRFRDYPEEGFAYLEDLMEGKDPSPGYSILAKIMEDHQHRVVITTNFDNLVADALSIYTDTYPFVCGHEALTSFVRASMRRPLVCKIHRDLLLGPKNDPRSLKRLHEAWAGALRPLLAQYTPLFIGYGGNDDSLMDMLESLETGEIKGQLVWCYYEREEPSERIKSLVVQHSGALVPVPDFDLFMILLGAEVGIGPLDEVIESRAKQRAENYRKRIIDLDTTSHPMAATALASTFQKAGGALAVDLKAKNEPSRTKREQIYQQGLQQFPNDPELHIRFAGFLIGARKLDEAENLVKKVLKLEPRSAVVFGLLGFIASVKRKLNDAEHLYQQSLNIAPNDYRTIVSYANLLSLMGKTDEAEQQHARAFQLAPKDGDVLSSFGMFKSLNDQDEEGERLILKAIKLEPQNMWHMRKHATLLIKQARFDEAERAIENAWANIRDTEDFQSPAAAKLMLYNALVKRAHRGDDAEALGTLKTILNGGFIQLPWQYQKELQAVLSRLDPEDQRFYSALADAIDDIKNLPKLDAFERWKKITPVPLPQRASSPPEA